MKKKVLSLGLLLCLMLMLVSCGGREFGKDDTSSSISTQTSVSEESAASQDTEAPVNTSASGTTNVPEASAQPGASTTRNGAGQTTSATTAESIAPPDIGNLELANPVDLKTGSTPMEQSLNFGGKTFTMAITQEDQYHTTSFTRMLSAFQAKYNCKITTKELVFETYNQQVTQAMSAGAPYDIAFMHGSMFPSAPNANLYNDLSGYITTADLISESNPEAGGIDLEKSSYFVWKGELTGVCNYYDVFPVVIYYNKSLFKANDLEDPLELYNKGQWTWNKIKSMGQNVTNSSQGLYFLSNEFMLYGTLHSFGTPLITTSNGKVINNFDSQGIINGLSLIRSLFVGSNSISEPASTYLTSGNEKYKDFLQGSVFMTIEESSKYPTLASSAATSIALQRSKDNIGIVPVPLDASNTKKAYPTGWMTATCSGKGSADPRVAVAWAKFKATYTDPVKGSNELDDTQRALVNKLISGNICAMHGAYASSSASTMGCSDALIKAVAGGADIAQTVNNLLPMVDASIEATIN